MSPVTTQYRLKKAIRTGTHNTTTYTYAYNQAGQLTNYTIRAGATDDSPNQTTVFTYDQQGQLTSAERLPASSFLPARLTYTYDDKGNLSQVTVYEDVNRNGQFKLTQTITLEYGADKLPIKTIVTSGNGTGTTRYTYDHGNAIKTEQTLTPGSNPVWTVQYRHDDKPNPTFGLLTGTPNAEMFNKNNIIYEGCEMTYTNGLLTLIHTNVRESPDVQSYIKYEYESY
ncbi:hypothetical protein [Spirosoma radiotolerans]|uniref:Uncharacterized protein n=1 Tax=Spirosoma radiotolerans TaxID=1379870 RepID=A0A0E3ZSW8_9BACT|nr:hypothetical protein [Spirosoma radiotolerans]AKD53563.1 hypothetical protein SD10_00240 [Spirosoma radiotolerans]